MAHLLHDAYDWYTDLIDNRSGELSSVLFLFVLCVKDPYQKFVQQ